LPERAVVLAAADHIHSGSIYAQAVLGMRPDVDVITTAMLQLPWYRARWAERGLVSRGTDLERISVEVTERALAAGRPVLVDVYHADVHRRFTTHPYGPLLRVVPSGTPQLSLDEMIQLNREIYAAFDLAYPRPGANDGYGTGIHKAYARTWAILAAALANAGREDEAQATLEVAKQLQPAD